MNKMISPLTYSSSSILKKINSAQSKDNQVARTSGNILEEKLSNEDMREIQKYFLNEKRENMFLRQENVEQRRQVDKLKQSNYLFQLEIDKLKTQGAKDREYLIKLEQMLMMSKSKLERTKREKYFNKVTHLNGSSATAEDIASIQVENERMKQFKSEIYRLSREYDSINTAMFALIEEIRNLFEELNENRFKERDGSAEEREKACFSKTKSNTEEVFDLMVKAFNTKQDEYKYLLDEKDLNILELNEAKSMLMKEKNDLIEDKLIKESIIDDLKNEIFLMKERREKTYSSTQSTQAKKKKKGCALSFCEYKTPMLDKKPAQASNC